MSSAPASSFVKAETREKHGELHHERMAGGTGAPRMPRAQDVTHTEPAPSRLLLVSAVPLPVPPPRFRRVGNASPGTLVPAQPEEGWWRDSGVVGNDDFRAGKGKGLALPKIPH